MTDVSGSPGGSSRPWAAVFGAFALGMIGLAVVGATRAHSPVPVSDMWLGTIGFYLEASDGVSGAWWRPINEHRIVLSRLLFFVDLRWFGGRGVFLVACHYALVAAIAGLLVIALRDRSRAVPDRPSGAPPHDRLVPAFAAFIVGAAFHWMQKPNLVWAYQSQMFLVLLLPLVAFYALHRSRLESGDWGWFGLACSSGVLANGAMANGVAVLPLLVLYVALTRQGWVRLSILSVLAVTAAATTGLLGDSSSAASALVSRAGSDPGSTLRFLLLFLGSPIFHVLDGLPGLARSGGEAAAMAAGAALLIAAAFCGVRALRDARAASLEVALVLFVGFVAISGLATASGRLDFGEDYALARRYSTPPLFAWLALFVLGAPIGAQARRTPALLGMLVLAIAMLRPQLGALDSHEDERYGKEIAALAVELGVRDNKQLRTLFWNLEMLEAVSEPAVARNLSIFGAFPFADAREQLGTPLEKTEASACRGRVTEVARVYGDGDFARVRGWVFLDDGGGAPERVRVVAPDRSVVGFGLVGARTPEAARERGATSARAGFYGYLRLDGWRPGMTLVGDRPACEVDIAMPAVPPFVVMNADRDRQPNIGEDRIVDRQAWTAPGRPGSRLPGMRVLSSGGADTGAVRLRVARGDRLLLRTGPVRARQSLEIVGSARRFRLPAAREWQIVEFTGAEIDPAGSDVVIRDGGRGATEWAEIAVRRGRAEPGPRAR